jgi:hypothetical protein
MRAFSISPKTVFTTSSDFLSARFFSLARASMSCDLFMALLYRIREQLKVVTRTGV